jgi:hypothetical protein
MQFHIEKALRAKTYLLVWDRVGTTTPYFKAMEVLLEAGTMQ